MVQPTTKGQIPSAEAACSAEDDHTETSGGQERQQTQRSQALMNGRIAPAPRPPGRCGEPRHAGRPSPVWKTPRARRPVGAAAMALDGPLSVGAATGRILRLHVWRPGDRWLLFASLGAGGEHRSELRRLPVHLLVNSVSEEPLSPRSSSAFAACMRFRDQH